jgi:hypothetical protein
MKTSIIIKNNININKIDIIKNEKKDDEIFYFNESTNIRNVNKNVNIINKRKNDTKFNIKILEIIMKTSIIIKNNININKIDIIKNEKKDDEIFYFNESTNIRNVNKNVNIINKRKNDTKFNIKILEIIMKTSIIIKNNKNINKINIIKNEKKDDEIFYFN